MGRKTILTLALGLILVGAASNNGWSEDRSRCVGAETWLRIRSAFLNDERGAEIRREEARGDALRYGGKPLSGIQRGIWEVGGSEYPPKPRYLLDTQETVPAQGMSR